MAKNDEFVPPDAEFLAKLTYYARYYGWQVDYNELADFVKDMHGLGGVRKPDVSELEPFEYNSDERRVICDNSILPRRA